MLEARKPSLVHYPDSDGMPLSDNTTQLYWIILLKENLDVLLSDFVAGDLLWYPIEGDNVTKAAPDVMVALGRPKGPRGSYKQWEEGGIAPRFVVEVLSPSNTAREMREKRLFYEAYGVDEYCVIDPELEDPESAILEVWERRHGRLQLADFRGRYQSPNLGISFERLDGKLVVRHPDGTPFLTTAQRKLERDAIASERDAALEQRRAAEERADRLAARLRALGIDPEA